MVEKVKCAVLGLGRLGWRHAENLVVRVPDAQVVAVADIAPGRAAAFAQQYDVPFHTSDVEQIFELANLDAIVIVSPTTSHATHIRSALAAQKAVFVEKPVTLSLDDAREIQELVHTSHSFCQVGFMRRYDPAYHDAWQKLRQGAIGKPLYFKAMSRDPVSPPEDYIRESGRLFIDMNIHDYDIARFLMGEEVSEIQAMGAIVNNPFMAKYNDIDQAISFLHFSSGALGDIEGSRNAGYGYDIRAEVLGTEGTLQIGWLTNQGVRILDKAGARHEIVPGFLERFADAYVLEIQDFIARLRRGDEPAVTVEDGYKALAIAYAATRSFDEQRAVKLAYTQ